MNPEELIEFCKNVMTQSQVIIMTTIDTDGFPESRAMFNLKNKTNFPTIESVVNRPADPFYSLIGTNTSSNKVKEIHFNPKATIYYCIPEKFHGLTLTGTISVIDDMSLKKELWVDGWEVYYPQGYKDPDYTILQLVPHYARGWYGSGKYAFKISYPENQIAYDFIQM